MAPWSSLRQVLDGQTIPVQALVARHNEHRILVTRLLFLLDLLDGGRDRISTAASLAFQALHAGIWLVLLRRTDAAPTLRWLVGGTVVAMLFTLRQGDNFISGFQAQFTGVFALNVATALLLLPRTVRGAEAGSPPRRRLAIGTASLLALPFTMANGLLAGPACAATGLLLRSRAGRVSALLASSASILSVILDRVLSSDGTRAIPLPSRRRRSCMRSPTSAGSSPAGGCPGVAGRGRKREGHVDPLAAALPDPAQQPELPCRSVGGHGEGLRLPGGVQGGRAAARRGDRGAQDRVAETRRAALSRGLEASMERHRRWTSSGWLPPQIAARFTMGEAAALSAIAAEVTRPGMCRPTIGHIAALAGGGPLDREERRQAGRGARDTHVRGVAPVPGRTAPRRSGRSRPA